MRSLPPRLEDEPGLAEAHATLTRILAAIDEYVYTGEFLAGGEYRVVFAGPCREKFLGLTAAEACGAIWADYVHPDDMDQFASVHDRALTSGRLDSEYRLVGADGVVRWVRDRGRIREEEGRRFLDGSILDVTAVHEAREQLEAARAEAQRLADSDPLTGLANRRLLPARLAAHAGRPLGILALDADRFKQVNDLFGHAIGDAVLVELAGRLRRAVRAEDEVLRLGGEEFLVLLPEVADVNLLENIAVGVCGAVGTQPFRIGAQRIPVTVSVGAALAHGEHDGDELLATADRFLYAAKRAGRDRVHVGTAHTPPIGDRDGVEPTEALGLAFALARVAATAEGLGEGRCAAVGDLAARLARRLGGPPSLALRCRLAGLLHDLGKVRVPVALLTKPGRLDQAESALVRRHAEHGAEMVAAVPELAVLAPIVRHQHERWDGTGYPAGLRGEEIPLETRIIAVADAWCAMTRDRPYRLALGPDEAQAELARAAGGQLDPVVVGALRADLAGASLPGTRAPGPRGTRSSARPGPVGHA